MGICAKCSSKDLIDEAQIVDHGDMNAEYELGVKVYRDPGAFVMKGKMKQRVLARVCGSCGYLELYAENPRELLGAAKEARERLRRKK